MVIPAFNEEARIERALHSVLRQTWRADEIIVIDDGSTDETAEVVRTFSEVLYIHQQNRGRAAARNRGIRAARSQFLAFLDADDEWTLNKLEKQLSYMADVGAQFAYTDTHYIVGDKRLLFSSIARPGTGRTLRDLVSGSFITTNTVVVKRCLLEKHGDFDERPAYDGNEDYEMWLRLACHGVEFHYLDEPLAVYHAAHTAGRAYRARMEQSFVQILEDFLVEQRVEPDVARVARNTISRISARTTLRHVVDGRWRCAGRCAARAWRYGSLGVVWRGLGRALRYVSHR